MAGWMIVYRLPGERWRVYDTCTNDPEDIRMRVKNCHDRHPDLEECAAAKSDVRIELQDVLGADG
jgi:hypothetical protein